MAVDRKLITAVRAGLQAAADPTRAPGMQAYMKSAMPYYGVSATPLRKVLKEVFAAHPLEGAERWVDTALALWRGAKYREERYAAIDLTGHKLYRSHQIPDLTLPMYEEMVVTGAWWDYNDQLAIHRIGPLLKSHPDAMRSVIAAWSTDTDLWRRRTAITCQISFKADTDLDLLYACIAPNMDDKDFFIRKGIGWALRAYAWIDPEEVVHYVSANEDRMSGLSKREALKNVNRKTPAR